MKIGSIFVAVCLLTIAFVAGMITQSAIENPKEYIIQLRPYYDETSPRELSVDIDILDKDRRKQFFNGTFHWRQKDKPFTIVGREGLFYRGYEQFGYELYEKAAVSYLAPRFAVE